jgi:hypothetical protein
MKRVPVPDGNGGELGWFDIRGIGELTEDHQIEYLDLADKLRQDKREALAAVPPENPAVMLAAQDETPVRLTRKDLAPVHALVEGWVIADSSFGIPLPHPLPLPAGNVLRAELDPIYGSLNGETPKENQDSDSTSTST